MGSWGPVSAANAACWLIVHALIDSVCRGSVSISTRSRGAARYPTRHPVIANALEKPLSVTVRSRIPGRVAMERCSFGA